MTFMISVKMSGLSVCKCSFRRVHISHHTLNIIYMFVDVLRMLHADINRLVNSVHNLLLNHYSNDVLRMLHAILCAMYGNESI